MVCRRSRVVMGSVRRMRSAAGGGARARIRMRLSLRCSRYNRRSMRDISGENQAVFQLLHNDVRLLHQRFFVGLTHDKVSPLRVTIFLRKCGFPGGCYRGLRTMVLAASSRKDNYYTYVKKIALRFDATFPYLDYNDLRAPTQHFFTILFKK